MMSHTASHWFAALLLLGIWSSNVGAAEKSAAELLPPTTVAYVEMSQPKLLLDVVLDHPLRQRVESLDEYRKGLEGREFQQFKAMVEALETQIGMKWRPALAAITEGGIYVGVDAKTQGVAVLIKSRDAATLEKTRDALLDLIRREARNRGGDDPVKSGEYRGLSAYRIGAGRFVTLGPWLVLTNKDTLGQQIADYYLDGGRETFAGDEQYQAARATISGQPTAWAFVNLVALRGVGVGKELFQEKNDNPGAEVLLGGIVSTLEKAPYATASIYVEQDRLALRLAMPHDASWTPQRREYFFGADGRGAAPQPLEPPQTLLSIGTYRDLGRMWLLKDDLFTENVAAQLTQAEGNLTTLFSGRDFGREVLGAARPELQLVLTRQTFDNRELPLPDIKLPAGALVFRLREPETMQRQLKVLFQSLIGFLNVAGAQQGQPPLEQNTEKSAAGQLISASYLPDSSEGRINYNFSPSVAFTGDRFIVSSATPLAMELMELAAKQSDDAPAANNAAAENTRASLNLQVLGDVLKDNRGHLVAQNVLEKGHDKQQAEKEIDALLALLSVGKTMSLRLVTENNQVQLDAELTLDLTK